MRARRFLPFAAAGVAGAATFLATGALGDDARMVAAIAVAGLTLWLTEALPLHVTGLLVTLLLVTLGRLEPRGTFAAYFDPVVALLLGGFALGRALQRRGLDAYLASFVLRVAGTRPALVLLALMVLAAVLSMWISNTAATAVVLPIAVSLAVGAGAARGAPLAKALVLGVAFAASLGGLATPIGSTPNPLALRYLREQGAPIGFGEWMLVMVPVAGLLVLAAWAVLLAIHKLPRERLVQPAQRRAPSRQQIGLMAVFTLTVVLWLTEPWHGQPSGVVALVPIVLLFAFRLLEKDDFAHLGWDVLILIGASIALGDAVRAVGLDRSIADAFALVSQGAPPILLFAGLALVALALTTVLSNTAAAVVLIPPLLPFADALGIPARALVLVAVVGVSADLLVPIGTPPNAMAYGTGHVRIPDMLRAGVPVALLAILVAAGLGLLLR